MKTVTPLQRRLSYVLVWLIGLQPMMPTLAAVNVASGNTKVEAAGNGVPVVNIVTPNGAGVSHNLYHNFDVGSSGLILNNATGQLNATQLGGLIQNNPNLQGTSASVIINEVVSPNRSQLNGYLEVAGPGAHVMVANPYGITCDGCGFINTPRVTLSTGRPVLDAQGQWQGLDVRRGDILITGQGLDASNSDYFSLIARTANLQAGLNAKDARLVLGANQVDSAGNATAQSGDGAAPSLALDTGALGGMYANRIHLISTEQGVGVNTAGLSARSGDIQLTADGRLSLGNTVASGTIQANGREVALSGKQQAGGTLTVNGTQGVQLQGSTVRAGQTVSLSSSGKITLADSQIGAGVDDDGTVRSGYQSRIEGDGVTFSRSTLSADTLSLQATQGISQDIDSRFLAGSRLVLNSADAVLEGDASAQDVHITSTRWLSGIGRWQAEKDLSLGIAQGDWAGKLLAGGTLSVDGDALVQRGMLAASKIGLNLGALDNQGEISAEQGLSFNGERLANTGRMLTHTALNLQATSLNNVGTLSADHTLTLMLRQGVVNQGSLLASQDVVLDAGSVDNAGTMSGSRLSMNSGNLSNSGTLQGQEAATLTVSGAFNQSATGSVVSGGRLGVQSGSQQTAGRLQANALTLRTGNWLNTGDVSLNGDGTISLNSLDNAGTLLSAGTWDIQSVGFNNSGTLQGNRVWVAATDILNSGRGQSVGAMQLNALGTLTNRGDWLSGEQFTVAAPQLVNLGSLQAPLLSLSGQQLTNAGQLTGIDQFTLSLSGGLTNQGTLSGNDLAVSAANADNTGTILGSNHLGLTIDHALANTGSIRGNLLSFAVADVDNRAAGTLLGETVYGSGRLLSNHGGITGTGSLTLQLSEALDNGGTLEGQQLAVTAATLDNRGKVLGVDALTLAVAGRARNQGQWLSKGETRLTAGTLENTGTWQGDRVTGEAQAIDNAGQVLGLSALTLTSGGRLDNQQPGQLLTAGAAVLQAATVNNQGAWQTGSLTLRATALNNGGQIQSDNDLTVTLADGGHIDNSGTLAAGGDLRLTATQLSNPGALSAAGQAQLAIGQINNAGRVASDGALTLWGNYQGAGLLYSNDVLTLQGDRLSNDDGGRWQAATLSLSGERLENQGTLLGDALTWRGVELVNGGVITGRQRLGVTLDGALSNQGTLGGGAVSVDAAQLSNHGGITGTGSLTLQLSGALDNGGTLEGQQLAVTAATLDNRGKVLGVDALTLAVAGRARNQGQWLSKGETRLTAGTLENTGTWQGDRVTGEAQAIDNAGQVLGLSALTLTSGGRLDNQQPGQLLTAGAAVLQAATVNNQGAWQTGSLTLRATALNNGGQIQSDNDLNLILPTSAAPIMASLVRVMSLSSPLTTAAYGTFSNIGTVIAGGRGQITARELNNQGTLGSSGDLSLSGQQIDNSGNLLTNGLMTLVAEILGNTGRWQGQTLSVAGNSLNNQGTVVADSGAQLQLSGDVVSGGDSQWLSNGLWQVRAGAIDHQGVWQGKSLAVTANSLTNNGSLLGVDSATLSLAQRYDGGTGSRLLSNGAITLNADAISQSGELGADQLTLTTGALDNAGRITGLSQLAVSSRSVITNRGDAQLLGNGIATLSAAKLDNQGTIQSDNLTLQSDIFTNGGRVQGTSALELNDMSRYIGTLNSLLVSGGAVTAHVADVNNAGTWQANRLDVTGNTLVNTGLLAGVSGLTLSVDGIDNRGQLYSQGAATLTGRQFDNSGTLTALNGLNGRFTDNVLNRATGQLLSNGLGEIVTGAMTNQGLWQSQMLQLTSGGLVNSGRMLGIAQADLQLNGDYQGDVNGQLVSGGALTVNAQQIVNPGLLQGQSVTLRAVELNNQGRLNGTGALSAVLDSTLSNLASGQIGGGNVTLQATQVTNQGSIVAESLGLGGTDVRNQALLQGRDNVTINVEGTLSNQAGGQILSSGDTRLTADRVENGGWVQGQTLALNTAQLDNGGTLRAQGNLTLRLPDWTNQGMVQAGELDIGVNGTLTNQGTLLGLTRLALTANRLVNASGARLYSAGDLQLGTGQLEQNGQLVALGNLRADLWNPTTFTSTLAAGGQLTLNVNGDLVQAGRLQGNGVTVSSTGALTQQGTIVAGGGDSTLSAGGDLYQAESGNVQTGGSLNLLANGALSNRGFIGTASDLLLRAGGLIDNTSLLYSGGDMRLFSDALANRFGNILAGGSLWVQRDDAGNASSSLLNSSGTIETQRGDITVRTGTLTNQREGLTVTESGSTTADMPSWAGGTKAEIPINYFDSKDYDILFKEDDIGSGSDTGCGCWTVKIYYYLLGRSITDANIHVPLSQSNIGVEARGGSAQINSGRNILFSASSLNNQASFIYANNDINLSGNSLNNASYQAGSRKQYLVYKFDNREDIPSAYSLERLSSYLPFTLAGDPITEFTPGQSYNATIQAGGSINANFSQNISNTNLQPGSGGFIPAIATPTLTGVAALSGVDAQESRGLGSGISAQESQGVSLTDVSTVGMASAAANSSLNALSVNGSDVVTPSAGTIQAQSVGLSGNGAQPSDIEAPTIGVSTTPLTASGSNLALNAVATSADTAPTIGVSTTPLTASGSNLALNAVATSADTAPTIGVSTTPLTGSGSNLALNAVATSADTAPTIGVSTTPLTASGSNLALSATAGADGHVAAPLMGASLTALTQSISRELQQLGTQTTTDYPLPTSSNGLFVVDTGGRYLIRSNPKLSGLGQVDNSLFNDLRSLLDTQPTTQAQTETSSLLTDASQILGSSYLLDKLNLDADHDYRFLGDAEFDTRYISNAVLSQTGQRYLNGTGSDLTQMQTLMDNAAAAQQNLNLQLGVSLTAEQVAGLTQSIVWWENITVDGQTVLAPKLYLAQADRSNLQGSRIVANNVSLNAGGSIVNSGSTIQATNTLSASSGDEIVNNEGGVLKSDGSLNLVALNNLTNSSATIQGNTVTLASLQGDILNTTTLNTWQTAAQAGQGSGSLVRTDLGLTGSILADGALTLQAGRDIVLSGSSLSAGSALSLTAGNDIRLEALQTTTDTVDQRNGATTEQRSQGLVQSTLASAGDLSLSAGRDLTSTAAQLSATGTMALAAGRDLNLLSTTEEQFSSNAWTRHLDWQQTINQQGTTLSAGEGVSLSAGQDLTLQAAQVETSGALTAWAGNDLNLLSATESQHDFFEETTVKKGFLSKTTTHTLRETQQTTEQGSLLSAGSVTLAAGHDINVQGSSVAADGDVSLEAKNNINTAASVETYRQYEEISRKKSGVFSGGGIGFTIGSTSLRQTLDAAGTTQSQSVSTLGSTGGSVRLSAGQDVNLAGTDVIAARDVQIEGSNVSIDPGYDTRQQVQRMEQKSAGLTVALSGVVGSAVNSAVQAAQAVRSESDSRLQALQGMKAALSGYQAYQGTQIASNDKGALSFVGISVSLGAQRASSSQSSEQSQSFASTLNAGHDISVVARSGDITAVGSQLKAANNVELNASRAINLLSARNTESITGSNSSSGGNIGVSVGLSNSGAGFSVLANMNAANGRELGSGNSWSETTVDAGQQVSLKSGGDTRLIGAQVSGEQITANVGGDLLLQSQQDNNRYDSTQTSVSSGGSLTFGTMTGSGYLSASQDKLHSRFDSVQQQTGLFAGQGGYDVTVGNHTQLDGAVIGSTASADKNRLETGTLGWSNIGNQAAFSVSHSGVGLSLSPSLSLLDTLKTAALSGPSALMSLGRGENADSTTYAAVSEGELVIRHQAGQQQDVRELSRDVAHANNALSAIFDKEQEQKRLQTAQMLGELGGQVMETLRTAGEIRATQAAEGVVDKPDDATLKTQDEKEKAWESYRKALTETPEYKAVMASYGTGSDLQRAAQAATSVLQALAGGGNLQQALAGASAPYLAQLVKSVTMPVDEKKTTASDIAANAMGHALLGAVVAQLSGKDAVAGAVGASGGELAARALMEALYPGRTVNELTESEKQSLSALSTVAAGLAAGIVSGNTTDAAGGAQAGNNAVENNYLNSKNVLDMNKELEEADKTGADKLAIYEKYAEISKKNREGAVAESCSGNPLCAYGALSEADAGSDIANSLNRLPIFSGLSSDDRAQLDRFVLAENEDSARAIYQAMPDYVKVALNAKEAVDALGVGAAVGGKALSALGVVGKAKSGTQPENRIEQTLKPEKNWESARNKALDIVGNLGADSKPVIGRLEVSAGNGKVIGRQSGDGKVGWRVDYDPEKGTHINTWDYSQGKGPGKAIKQVIPFEGNEKSFETILKQLNR
ncbi:hemagglutinin repeat-containing protein [Musicola keenii]|uniref:hemagglutinin repeat-containing protein n=1 Tax=Musicola keenii TaxID=2884250 RepID=UPI001782FEFC|nr:hemagglutinin repeat-containing protein [Musicola keenii]